MGCPEKRRSNFSNADILDRSLPGSSTSRTVNFPAVHFQDRPHLGQATFKFVQFQDRLLSGAFTLPVLRFDLDTTKCHFHANSCSITLSIFLNVIILKLRRRNHECVTSLLTMIFSNCCAIYRALSVGFESVTGNDPRY